jgi:thermitase
MRRPGHLLVTLRPGEALPHLPAQLDCVLGAGRPAGRLDGGRLDRAVHAAGAFRAMGIYHARASLGRVGQQAAGFDDREERLGLSRSYAIELADPERTDRVVDALREHPKVESTVAQTFATAPFSVAAAATARDDEAADAAWLPHEQVRVPEAHRRERGAVDVTVGVVDTGIALGHPEFQRRLLAGYDVVRLGMGRLEPDVVLVGDSIGADFCPRDATGHGSHVAGVIGAHGWQLPPGVAGRSLLLPIRVLAAARVHGEDGTVGIGALSDISAGMKVCCDLGAVVLNLSFGTPASAVDPAGPQPHADVVRYALEIGCVLVAATGNTGDAEDFFPACLPGVIAVGSVSPDGRRSRFSAYGPHVALCAPGERIVSSGRDGYETNSGTSFAAPFVTGAAALLVARARRAGRELSSEGVRTLLIDSARPLGDGRRNHETGHGLLDVAAALDRLDGDPTPRPRATGGGEP